MEDYPRMYLYRRLVQAKLFIDGHCAEKMAIDNIADEAYFSKFHFIRLFKKVYGRTPHQYLTFVRIEKAKELLKTNLTATEVCSDIGFESVGSFTSLFKRMVGITPSVFQQQHYAIQREAREKPFKYVPGCFANNFRQVKKAILKKPSDSAISHL
jgi:AraC-like DNA-binding protein